DRTAAALIGHGLTLVEAIELLMPPIVNEIKRMPEELRGFYMYLRQAFGPRGAGPGGAVPAARGRVRVLRRRARAPAALAARDGRGPPVLERAGHPRDGGPGRRAEAAGAR